MKVEDGWPVRKLGELLTDIQPGFASGKHNSEGRGIPHLRPMNVSTAGQIDLSVVKYVERALASSPNRRLKAGDVLFNNTNSPELVGKTALFQGDDEPAFSNHMTRLRTDPKQLDPGYLALRLHHAWRQGWFEEHCNNHVSQASIGRGVLKDFEIEVPTLAEQRQICAIDDQVSITSSVASKHLTASASALGRFRKSVLLAACNGRLTTEWRRNHELRSALEIVELIHARRVDQRGKRATTPVIAHNGEEELPESWVLTSLGSLVDVATGATPLRKRKDYYEGGTVPWVTSGAVNEGTIDSAEEAITALALSETNAKLFPPGTLLVAMYGEGQTRGRVAELVIEAATNQAVAALLFGPASDPLRPYLRLFLEYNYERTRMLAVGGVQPNLSLGLIRDLLVPLPPLDEQAEIVRRVEHLFASASEVERRIENAKQSVDASRRALRSQVFRGELVANGRNGDGLG